MQLLCVILVMLVTTGFHVQHDVIYAQSMPQSTMAGFTQQTMHIPVPLVADAQTIFVSSPSSWRQQSYEVYRLNIGNNIIVIKFNSYAEQRKFFFRLTYFSNQNDNEYNIQPAPYYDGMHSYNANDYNPEVLANFFNQLIKQNMHAEQGEQLLLEMALSYHIIKKNNGKYMPLNGAIISFSIETEIKQRKRYLIHETMHGLFYTVPKLREAVFAIVENLSPNEKYFWYLFLKNKGKLDYRPGLSGYNTDNKYLIVNEIFAHIMQSDIEDFNDYFFTTYIPRMIKLLPDEKPFLEDFLKTNSSMFYNLRSQFSQALEKHCNLKNGILF